MIPNIGDDKRVITGETKGGVILDMDIQTSEDIPVPHRLVDQVIGQDDAVKLLKKAAIQRRNILLIGDPGTGKSMMGQALAELLPTDELQDIWCLPNPNNLNQPKIITVSSTEKFNKSKKTTLTPKLLVDNTESNVAPFNDATGAHAGALLGDVRHDPFQSGGLGTPAHERVEAGLIHKSHKGVLYMDEVTTLSPKTQQQLLTAMQDRKLAITGRSELSSGAKVKTEAVPCDFILVASGNVDTVRRMHPALRSRIRGYGYEIYMHHTIPDTMENRRKLARTVSQEVLKDGKIGHFTKAAIERLIIEARRRADRKNRLTLRLRYLGDLIRAAGDLAREEGVRHVEPRHVTAAKKIARSLEHQILDRSIEKRKEYAVMQVKGEKIGRVWAGLTIVADSTGARGGNVIPIEAQVTSSQDMGGKTIATGALIIIARESVHNVSRLIKSFTGKDVSKYDIHIQLLGVHGVEGDSGSIAIMTAIISDLKQLPVRQDLAMIGSLSIRGEILPVNDDLLMEVIEGAITVGIKEIIIPAANIENGYLDEDVAKIKNGYLDEDVREIINIIPVKTLEQVLKIALIGYS
jgi:Lon-like ATP-dependent protease